MNSSQVFCTNCGTLVPATDINIKTMAAKCIVCDHLFSIADKFGDGMALENFGLGATAPARPKKVTIESGPSNELYLKKRWFTPMLFGLAFFCAFWDAFLIFWYSIAFTQPDTPLMMILFPVLHVAAGIGLTYSVVAGFLNTTNIFADSYSVIVKHRPIPWLGNQELNAKDINRLTIKKSSTNYKIEQAQLQFQIMADVNGVETKLLGGLEPSEARYIAYQLAKQIKVDVG